MFQYEKDTSKVGTASDYGKQLMIGNESKDITRSNKSILQVECLRLIRSCTRLNDIMEQPLAMICRYY